MLTHTWVNLHEILKAQVNLNTQARLWRNVFRIIKNFNVLTLSDFRTSNQTSANVGRFVVECSGLWTDCRYLAQPGFEVGPSSYSVELVNNFVHNSFVENHKISEVPLLKPGVHISGALSPGQLNLYGSTYHFHCQRGSLFPDVQKCMARSSVQNCGSSIWNILHVTILARRIWKWLLAHW